jgi:IclR family transcriptional regulator, KDG regulon repressor
MERGSLAATPDLDEGSARRLSSAGVQAALSVLDLLGERGALALADLSRELGLPKSTLHRICSVLVDRGWAFRDQSGRFELGIRALAMGAHATDLPIVIGFRRAAADLLTKHDETVCLAILDGEDSVYVALEETSHPIRLVTHVGSRTPAFASASGRVILSGRTDEALAADYGGKLLVTPTGRRLNGLYELRAILDAVRTNGYAENVEETAVGLWAASVPVVNASGVILAALTICVPTSRIDPERRERILADLCEAGENVSADVGWLAAFNIRHPETVPPHD